MARTCRSEQEWRAIKVQWKTSDLRTATFCRLENITVSAFYRWRKRYDSISPSEEDDESDWLSVKPPVSEEAEPDTEQPRWDVELVLPGNVVLRIRH